MFYVNQKTTDSKFSASFVFTWFVLLKITNFLLNMRLYPLLSTLVLTLALTCLAEPALETEERLDSTQESSQSFNLYRDLTLNQSDWAHPALSQAYSGNPKWAHKSLASMRKLETAKDLPPLSYFLSIAIDVMRYQNGDFEDEDEEKALLKSIENAAEQGQFLCKASLAKDPNHATYLLIVGGIRGFLATLKIHTNPSEALGDGFQALKLLEKSRDQDSRIRDSYMGTGIFNCTAANAPLFVRATLKIIGRSVSMMPGLQGLRISAYQGQYTSVASQLFLIQFLSPYEEELKREKQKIFNSLQNAFSRNAYFTFLKSDEALCFYPDSFYTTANRIALSNRIVAFGTDDFSSRRYSNLVRYQYTLLDPTPSKRLAPDTTFIFRDYTFYPVFIEGLRLKRQTEDTLGMGESPSLTTLAELKNIQETCQDIIKDSPMNPTRKRYYQWHVTEALRWTAKPYRKRLNETVSTTVP